MRAPSFAGVVLAAGESSRMGQDKALLPWNGRTFLEDIISALNDESDLVIVVAGKNADRLRPVVYSCGAYLEVNPAPEMGQFSSLKVGLRAVLDLGRDAAVISPVDRPAPAQATLEQLRNRLLESLQEGKWAVIPEFQGRHGHPLLATREMIEAFLRAPLSSTAREVEKANSDRIEYVAVQDPNVVININTPLEYESALEASRTHK